MTTPTTHDIEKKFDEMYKYSLSYEERKKEMLDFILSTVIPHTKEEVIREVLEIVEQGNLDPDFEYKKEYYKGHNEFREHLRQTITNLREMK